MEIETENSKNKMIWVITIVSEIPLHFTYNPLSNSYFTISACSIYASKWFNLVTWLGAQSFFAAQ